MLSLSQDWKINIYFEGAFCSDFFHVIKLIQHRFICRPSDSTVSVGGRWVWIQNLYVYDIGSQKLPDVPTSCPGQLRIKVFISRKQHWGGGGIIFKKGTRQCWGSVIFWFGSGSRTPDLYLLTNGSGSNSRSESFLHWCKKTYFFLITKIFWFCKH